jgi:hypothetical protein
MSSLCLTTLFSDPAFDHCVPVYNDSITGIVKMSPCWRLEVLGVFHVVVDAMLKSGRAASERSIKIV